MSSCFLRDSTKHLLIDAEGSGKKCCMPATCYTPAIPFRLHELLSNLSIFIYFTRNATKVAQPEYCDTTGPNGK